MHLNICIRLFNFSAIFDLFWSIQDNWVSFSKCCIRPLMSLMSNTNTQKLARMLITVYSFPLSCVFRNSDHYSDHYLDSARVTQRVFELMKARWRSYPIKSSLLENQPTRGRPQIIYLKTCLRSELKNNQNTFSVK